MPINDSAGVGVYLIDKSQRASVAIGFRSAGAIEADRGLCNTPTLISSEADYVKTFGTPNMERHGLAAMEAFMLAQRQVPQVLTRAKNPLLDGNSRTFGAMSFTMDAVEGLQLSTSEKANSPKEPSDANTVNLYFKGEGTYCSSVASIENNESPNIVVRMSEPVTKSAYAKEGHSLNVQVYDFDGASHIDEDREANFAFNPDVAAIVNNEGDLYLDGYTLGNGSGSGVSEGLGKVYITAFVNGRTANLEPFDYSKLHDDTNNGVEDSVVYKYHTYGIYDWFIDAIMGAKTSDGKPIINPKWSEGQGIVYDPCESSGSDSDDSMESGIYRLDARAMDETKGELGKQELNCFDLSITLTLSVDLDIYELDPSSPNYRKLSRGFYNFPCGSVAIVGSDKDGWKARFRINTNLYLKNRTEYMYLGEQNKYWASYYNAYLKESYDISLSYDDYDSNYVSMQSDAVMGGSHYLISKSSETFTNDYSIDYANSKITNNLHYFDARDIESNTIVLQNKSYAYSQALVGLLSDNLTRWRCLATPNLGDVMNPADYLAVITAAEESTLGLSNIGRAAATDVFGNLTGRHGNRFIADYSQYAYRTLAGKRTAVTMACLVSDLLNTHYNEGMEARPPFGYNYGQISCLKLSQEFSGAERNMLARQLKINPVIEDGGYFIWDERTSQLTDTSLSDIHCIISFIWMKFAIYDAMKAFVAEYNDQSTVNRGLAVLNQLNQTFISRNYIEEGLVSAGRNVIGDEVLRFDYAVRFKGVARFVDVYITAYSQTQTLAVSLAQEA